MVFLPRGAGLAASLSGRFQQRVRALLITPLASPARPIAYRAVASTERAAGPRQFLAPSQGIHGAGVTPRTSAAPVWSRRLPERCGAAVAGGARAFSGGDDADRKVQADLFTRKFLPTQPPQQLGMTKDWKGMTKVLEVGKLTMSEMLSPFFHVFRIWLLFGHRFDKFQLDEFMKMYFQIRHISANASTEQDLELLEPLISEDLMQTLKDNTTFGTAEGAVGVSVHNLAFVPISILIVPPAPDLDNEPGAEWGKLLLSTEWLTIKIRYVAVEETFTYDAAGERQPGTFEPRVSTWTFRGRFWNVPIPNDDDTDAPSAKPSFLSLRRRTVNPDMQWVLTNIE